MTIDSWRRKTETRDAARGQVKDSLDELPDACDPEIRGRKSEAVFDHIFTSYHDDGTSVYRPATQAEPSFG
ncbi:MAG: hypothetical protein M9938_01650 [Solirubrobacterales bacterium]|nr:hypothetical protein [Solirubrobacterales bacterium]